MSGHSARYQHQHVDSGLLDAQRLLASIALSRPAPFGVIPPPPLTSPLRRASGTGLNHSTMPSSTSAARRRQRSKKRFSLFDVPPSPLDADSDGLALHHEEIRRGKRKVNGAERREESDNDDDDGEQADVRDLLSPISPSDSGPPWARSSSPSSTNRTSRSTHQSSSRSRDSTAASTPSSSRSSSLRRKPSLLNNQCPSPPTSSSFFVPALGRSSKSSDAMAAARSSKESQSLVDRSTLSSAAAASNIFPSLYSISRGRSKHVSPSRRWDRRGASASVLSSGALTSPSDAARQHADFVNQASNASMTTGVKARQGSNGSLEAALFASDDDDDLFASSGEEDDVAEELSNSVLGASRRSSVERDRKRELRILLAPSTSLESSISGLHGHGKALSQSANTIATTSSAMSGSEEFGSSADQLSASKASHESNDKDSARSEEKAPSSRLLSSSLATPSSDILADDEAEGEGEDEDVSGTTSTVSLLRRRSRGGRRELPLASMLKTASPTKIFDPTSTLDTIPSGMTPDEKAFDDIQESASISPGALVDAESDPLLGQSFGSVADNMQLDTFEWDDAASQRGSAKSACHTPTSSPKPDTESSKSMADREDERRTGFAAAYHQRVAALSMRIWTPSRGQTAKNESGRIDSLSVVGNDADVIRSKSSEAPQQSLLSSGWRHLTMLPNFLLMPTVGPSAAVGSLPQNHSPEELDKEASVKERVDRLADPPQRQVGSMDHDEAARSAATHLGITGDGVSDPMQSLERALREAESDASSLSSSTSKKANATSTTGNVFLPSQRSGRGVMTPLEGDADISAYVPGLGLPIDPDVELSSVVHLQTFRLGSSQRARRRNLSVSQERHATAPTASIPSQHRRTNSEGQHASVAEQVKQDASDAAAVAKVLRETLPTTSRQPSNATTFAVAQKKRRSSRRAPSGSAAEEGAKSLSKTPRCSRPAVQAPVPETFSAYNSSCSESDDTQSGSDVPVDVEKDVKAGSLSNDPTRNGDISRGGGRGRRQRRKRSTSPIAHQQCAIGLFSSSPKASLGPSSLRRTRSGRGRMNCSSAQTAEDGDRDTLTDATASVLRVRSSPNLSRMGHEANDDDLARGRKSSGLDDRRGRAGSVKRVSASVTNSDDDDEWGVRSMDRMKNSAPSISLRRTASTGVLVERLSPLSTAKGEGLTSPSIGGHRAVSQGASTASASFRLPLVGAENISHLAGRPSMVSNGAHLLMLSLELEMMRNRKITGSLKPRWLKARMRMEPFDPTAVVTPSATVDDHADEMDELALEKQSHAPTHHHQKQRVHFGPNTPHHASSPRFGNHLHHHHHRRYSHQGMSGHHEHPQRLSGLRFEVLPSV